MLPVWLLFGKPLPICRLHADIKCMWQSPRVFKTLNKVHTLKPLTRCTRRGGVWVNTAFDVYVLKFTAAASLYHHPTSTRLVVLNYLQLGGITPSADSFLSDMGALLWFQCLLSSLLESAFKEVNWHWKKDLRITPNANIILTSFWASFPLFSHWFFFFLFVYLFILHFGQAGVFYSPCLFNQ